MSPPSLTASAKADKKAVLFFDFCSLWATACAMQGKNTIHEAEHFTEWFEKPRDIDVGPGYRVYYAQDGLNVYLLIIGGDNSSQTKDISKAKELWRMVKEERQ